MLQTLFVIPHFLFQGPLLVIWLVLGLAIFGYLYSKSGFKGETLSFIPIYFVVAAVIYFLLPHFEVKNIDNEPIGLAVRGYGFFLLLAIGAGLTVAWIRCQQIKYDFEIVLSLAFWMILCGIAGARIFYLVQKKDELASSVAPADWPVLLFNVTEGGLVVYGAVIGGLIALLAIVIYRRLPLMKIADIIAPGMVIGLSIGRIGCLMNGCCYGGTCDIEPIAIKFPPGSPPYMRQIENGEMFGMKTRVVEDEKENIVAELEVLSVEKGSFADKKGIKKGDHVSIWPGRSDVIREVKSNPDSERQMNATISHPKLEPINIPVRELPDRGVGIHPTQIYSSINAGLLFLFLWFYYPYRRGEGEVFAWMLMIYAVTRFLLEAIRVDELGVAGTPFSISQLISFGTLAVGIAVFVIARRNFPIRGESESGEAATIS